MREWLFIHDTMIAYCRYCTMRAQWAYLERNGQRIQILGFFCKGHRQERELGVLNTRKGEHEGEERGA